MTHVEPGGSRRQPVRREGRSDDSDHVLNGTREAVPERGSRRWRRLPEGLQRLADLGSSEHDSEGIRVRKRVLNLAAALMVTVSPVWIITYSSLGIWPAATIPAVYVLVSAMTIVAHARTGLYRAYRVTQLGMMLTLPLALQATLGGFANSSAVGLWSLTAPLGAVFFVGARQAVPWFAAFVVLVAALALFDAPLAEGAPAIPQAVIISFFALNMVVVSTTVFVMLQYFVRAREKEQERSERLLLNVLPASIATRLKVSPDVIADGFDEATVLFADLVDFTPLAERVAPGELVRILDRVFAEWDAIALRHGLEKIKTIGDAYMAAAGVPEPRSDHALVAARMALEMRDGIASWTREGGPVVGVRIGIASGPVVAGVIGRSKFIYDLWGDTVNIASRMESSARTGEIQVTGPVHDALVAEFRLRRRGWVEIKGKGPMETHLLEGRKGRAGRPARLVGG